MGHAGNRLVVVEERNRSAADAVGIGVELLDGLVGNPLDLVFVENLVKAVVEKRAVEEALVDELHVIRRRPRLRDPPDVERPARVLRLEDGIDGNVAVQVRVDRIERGHEGLFLFE